MGRDWFWPIDVQSRCAEDRIRTLEDKQTAATAEYAQAAT